MTDPGHDPSSRTLTCGACGYANPADHSLCFICGHALSGAASPTPSRDGFGAPPAAERRAYLASLADEEGVVRLLRLLYLLYALGYAALTVSMLIAGQVGDLAAPQRFLLLLQPLLSLLLVLIALRRLEDGPLAWALVMAGMETLALFRVVADGTWKSPHTIAAVLLWAAVFACARTTTFREAWASGRPSGMKESTSVRLAGAVLLLYAGVFVLLLQADTAFEGWTAYAVFYGGLAVVGVVAGVVAGGGVLRDALRFRIRLAHLLPSLVALLIVILADTLWLAWRRGHWIPEVPQLAWPGLEVLVTLALVPALVEEWQCRGVMWSCLRSYVGTAGTILATATLFALMHGLSRSGGLSSVIPQLIAGVVLGVLRARTGSLVPCMVVHALGNLYIGAWIAGYVEARAGL